MIDFSNSVYILNTKNLPTNVNKLLNPIVLHRVVNLYKKGLQIQFFLNTWLLGHFTPIFYLIHEHFLFVYTVKQKQTKFRENKI